MAITYTKLSEITEKWGIDVSVRFADAGIDVTKTFNFKTQLELDKDFVTRMAKAIANIENDIAESQTPNEFDIIEKALEYVDMNITGNQQHELLNILNGNFVKEGGLNV